MAKFSIGIDLGTTNCAMAFAPLDTANPHPETFLIPQWETVTGFSEASTLPSFLYLPTDQEAAQMSNTGTEKWVPGRLARRKPVGSPGPVAHSAKPWLCHLPVCPTTPFPP